jgi:hypothetical protein
MYHIERGNYRMKTWGRMAVPLSLTLVLMAGCESQNAQSRVLETPAVQQAVQPAQKTGETNVIVNTNGQQETNSVVTNAADPKEDPANGQTQQAATSKPKVPSSDNYNASKPTLMGLTLSANKATVISKFGEPKSLHMLTDDAGSVQVFDYADFSIGFKVDGRLEFVEVNSNRVDPGLKGLRVGQKAGDAIATLGKPNINTGYVLAYESEGTVLKLDIDVAADQVLSIKLFPGK